MSGTVCACESVFMHVCVWICTCVCVCLFAYVYACVCNCVHLASSRHTHYPANQTCHTLPLRCRARPVSYPWAPLETGRMFFYDFSLLCPSRIKEQRNLLTENNMNSMNKHKNTNILEMHYRKPLNMRNPKHKLIHSSRIYITELLLLLNTIAFNTKYLLKVFVMFLESLTFTYFSLIFLSVCLSLFLKYG